MRLAPAFHPAAVPTPALPTAGRITVRLHQGVDAMNDLLLRSWWVLALRGVIAILFGVLALFWPDLTLLVLVALFAAYALLSGIVSIAGAARNRRSDDNWWMLLLLGLVGIAAGIIAIVHPGLTALVLVLLIGANALVTGVLDIAAAIRLRKIIRNEWLLVLNGIASLVFGVMVFLFPEAGALAIVWLVSLYALVTGVLMIGLGLRLRSQARHSGTARPDRRVTPDRRAAAHS
jgi:uncharacterized membrane protein HdeD (DUF308 family)